jgi:hypothetical protein
MPPKDPLRAEEIAVLKHWIADGVPWPEMDSTAIGPEQRVEARFGDAWSDPSNPIAKLWGGKRLDLWSLRPIQAPAVPEIPATDHPVDRFVIRRLREAGLELSPEADRRTLIRRLAYDLTGLPPTLDEVAAFIDDSRPDAYQRLVERLLHSPAYAEHQARLWLDVVRYGDSNGFDWDEFRPQAWRFRDYVIRSFASDKPFDRFVREQLAGDELVNGPPHDAAEQDALLATGYLRLGMFDNSAASFNEQDRSRAELMADLTETTGSAFLGLTLGCCRCHDHKYDPISQVDHFRIRAFFESITFANELPIDLAAEQELIARHNGGLAEKARPTRERREQLRRRVRDRMKQGRAKDGLAGGPPGPVEAKTAKVDSAEVPDNEVVAAFSVEEKTEDDRLGQELEQLRSEARKYTYGLLATDAPGAVPPTRLFFQGNHKQPRQVIEPGYPSILDPNPALIHRGPNPKTSGRRLTLADWIVSPTNPLTARVFVNRIWLQHFGQGLVATPNDFGYAGARPSHPELLDWLAWQFRARGWSVKELHRTIVTSATYRQSSVRMDGQRERGERIDLFDSLYWRQSLRRLSAEQVRDSLLSASGLLNGRMAGAPVWPELPSEILQANPAFLDDNAEKTKGWYPSKPSEQTVRSVYLVQKRGVRVPFLETFDLPENAVSCARRLVSTVAPQAMSLLNSPLASEAAEGLARRVRAAGALTTREQVRSAFQLTLQRGPSAPELEIGMRVATHQSLTEFCRILLNLSEFIYVD